MVLETDAALDAVEAFFVGSSVGYQTVTLQASGRKLRVCSMRDSPWPGCHTHVAFDAVFSEWHGVRAKFRLLPILAAEEATDVESDAAFHIAYLLDWALSKGVPPRPTEAVLMLGHAEQRLPHIRFDYPFPWEREQPAKIAVGDHTLIPVLAYSISQQELDLQQSKGAKALDAHFERHRVPLFDRRRDCSFGKP